LGGEKEEREVKVGLGVSVKVTGWKEIHFEVFTL
jgi:hypothetical protein